MIRAEETINDDAANYIRLDKLCASLQKCRIQTAINTVETLAIFMSIHVPNPKSSSAKVNTARMVSTNPSNSDAAGPFVCSLSDSKSFVTTGSLLALTP